MTEYIPPAAVAVFAMAWALRLEAKQADINRALVGHEDADTAVHASIADDLKEIKTGQQLINSKVDQILLKFVPQVGKKK
jgi:hypothetical protein